MPLDFENERYVRIYTRDTVTWKLWDWKARGLWCLLLRAVDRSGVLDLGGHEPPAALAAVLSCPLDDAAHAYSQWLASGSIVRGDGALVVPRFALAQDSAQSDAQRQRESRARRRASALGEAHIVTDKADGTHPVTFAQAGTPVTKSDKESRKVTECHDRSQDVTPILSVPCRAEDETRDSATSPKPASRVRVRKPGDGAGKNPSIKVVIDAYHNAYLARHGTKPIVTGAHAKLVQSALRTITEPDLVALLVASLTSADRFFEGGLSAALSAAGLEKLRAAKRVRLPGSLPTVEEILARETAKGRGLR